MKRLSIFLFLTLFFATPAAGQTCTPSPTTACLLDDRFQVQVAWTDVPGNPHTLPEWGLAGDATVVPFGSRTALFHFFTPDTPTMVVKMIDATQVDGRFWLFASAATNVAFTLTVTDTATRETRSYTNPQWALAAAIADTNAFSAFAPPPFGAATAPTVRSGRGASHGPLPPGGPSTPCAAPVESLQDGRFEVQVCYVNQYADNQPGDGTPTVYSDTTNLVWLFRPDNLELLVSVVDGRHANDHFWVQVASLTDVNWTVTIRDTRTGAVWSHTNPPGGTDPVLDPMAFDDLSEVPTLSEWGLAFLVLLLLGGGWWRLRS